MLIGWSADGERIYFWEARGVTMRLCALHVETKEIPARWDVRRET